MNDVDPKEVADALKDADARKKEVERAKLAQDAAKAVEQHSAEQVAAAEKPTKLRVSSSRQRSSR